MKGPRYHHAVRRRLFMLFALGSSILFVAMAAISIHGLFHYDSRELRAVNGVRWRIDSKGGTASITREWEHAPDAPVRSNASALMPGVVYQKFDAVIFPGGGSINDISRARSNLAIRSVRVNWSVPLILSALLPAAWILQTQQRIRRRRLAAGCCIHCGYCLVATPERCPECGRVP